MLMPSTEHYTVYTYEEIPPNETFGHYVSQLTRNVIRCLDPSTIPPLMSEILPPDLNSAPVQQISQQLGNTIGHCVFYFAIALQAISIKSNITFDMIAAVRNAITCCDTMDVLAPKWRYTDRHHLFAEIARACTSGGTFEGVGIALAEMLEPIIARVITFTEGLSRVDPNGNQDLGQTQEDAGAFILPPPGPVLGPPNAVRAHQHIQAAVDAAVQNRSGTSYVTPWHRTVNFNLRCDMVHQAESLGDTVWNLAVMSALWDQKSRLDDASFHAIYRYLLSNSLLGIVSPLLHIDVERAFTQVPLEKSRGDLLEASLGFAFLENNEMEGDGKVFDTLGYILPRLVGLCIAVWEGRM